MQLAWALVSLVLALGAGCSSDESPVRGNVHEIYRGGLWEDERCSEQSFEYCCLMQGITTCTTFNHVVLVAVRHRGDRIGALVLVNGDHLVLAQSEDRGATWKTTDIIDDDYVRGSHVYLGGMDIVMTADVTWLYIPRQEVGGLGMLYSRGYLYRVDASGKLSTDDVKMPGNPPIEERDGRAIFIVPDMDPLSRDVSLLVYEVTPDNRSIDRIALVPCTEPGCATLSSAAFLGTDDGDLYYAFTTSAGAQPECLLAYRRSTQALSTVCMPLSEWPGNEKLFAVLPYAGQQAPLLRAFNRGDHVWAATMLDAGAGLGRASEPVDLGVGRLSTNLAFNLWPQFRGMAIVEDLPEIEGVIPDARLVRVPLTGPAQRVLLPTTPCEDDSKCGYHAIPFQGQRIGHMAWTEPLGNDDYLVFYRSDDAPGMTAQQEVISVSLEHATYKDVAAEPFPAAAIPGYPNAIEAAGIAAKCALQQSCGSPTDVLTCMYNWTTRPTVDAAKHRAALLAFLASPNDCTSFNCQGIGPNCARSGGDCEIDGNGSAACVFTDSTAACNTCTPDGRAITCNGSTITSVLDCTAVGQTCQCNGPACACVPPPCSAPAPSCVGDIYTECTPGQSRDCSLIGQGCTLEPFNAEASYFPGCSPPPFGSECVGNVWCDGRYLMFCVNGQPVGYDCPAQGWGAKCGSLEFTSVLRCLP